MEEDGLPATLAALTGAGERARSLAIEIRTLAARAVTEGATYGQIGRALGISRQGARQRFPRLLDVRPSAPPAGVEAAPAADSRPPARDAGAPDRAASDATTNVVAVAGLVAEEADEPSAAAPRAEVTTSLVAAPEKLDVPRRSDRDAARAPAARPRREPRPRARAGTDALDTAMRTATAMIATTGYTLERSDTGYRVLVHDVPCGTLQPVYGTTTKHPRGWLPMAPGLVSVFPRGRSYRTRDEAALHLLAGLRRRAQQDRGPRSQPRS